ncbi:helix-turn-helix domain-containing transcriptional regulator [Nitrosospira multiformis]|uniref:helix-turn-helix domain-containing transcriptional regulator n=1 Tax=Nitrosospira multiformis TaxID=1231 RepID=UPI0035235089
MYGHLISPGHAPQAYLVGRATRCSLAAVAAEAGLSRESLYRTLSPKGNPALKTLLAVLKTVGLRLSVEPEHHVHG